jgi:hypothetical protein
MFGVFSQVQGWIKIKGATDGTKIGNSSDSLKTTVTSSALPTGAATSANQTTANSSLSSIDTKVTGLSLETTQVITNTRIGDLTETAPVSDTASSGLNGRLQRIAQRLSSLITLSTDRSQKTQISNGTVEVGAATSTVDLSGVGLYVRPIPFEPLSYSATGAAFVPATTATDIFLLSGSNSKTIRVHKVSVSGTTTSGSAIKCTIKLIKRSTANTGGTSVTSTIVPHDSNNATATAVAKHYTANPTVGTDAGTIRSITNSFQASGITKGSIDFDFVNDGGQPVILRGTGENLAVNLNSTTITGGVVSVSVEWSEV